MTAPVAKKQLASFLHSNGYFALSLRYAPDPKIPARSPRTHVLPAGSKFVKAYNHDDAVGLDPTDPKYLPLDFNPVKCDDSKNERGRFSPSLPSDDFACYYVAEYLDPEHPENVALQNESIALWEYLEEEEIDYILDSNLYYPSGYVNPGYSFLYIETTRDILVASIVNQDEAKEFNADWRGGINSSDYPVSRAWGRYIRNTLPGARAVRYVSARFGPLPGRSPYVLHEPPPHINRHNDGYYARLVRQLGPRISFNSPEGIDIINRSFGTALIF